MNYKEIKNEIDYEINEKLKEVFFFPNTFYNSLDFMYKYAREVLIRDLSGCGKDFFKKVFTSIENSRYAREESIKSNSLYNNRYPMLSILINQDFSGAGTRTRMYNATGLSHLNPIYCMPTVFRENNMEMLLGTNIFKYNITLTAKFDSAFQASNFTAKVYSTVHVNKYFYPEYSELRYRLDKEIYSCIRAMYKSKYENDNEFLEYLNRYSTFKIIREYDNATGEIDYFLLIPIRPLVMIQTPTQSDMYTGGSGESLVTVNLDIEIELPTALYFSTPSYLLREINVKIYDNIILSDKNEEILNLESEERKKDIIKALDNRKVKNKEKIVTMPKIEEERIKDIHKKELKYTSTLSIERPTDILVIEDPIIINYIKTKGGIVIKIFDDDGNEIPVANIKEYDKCIDVKVDTILDDTIIIIKIYGDVLYGAV